MAKGQLRSNREKKKPKAEKNKKKPARAGLSVERFPGDGSECFRRHSEMNPLHLASAGASRRRKSSPLRGEPEPVPLPLYRPP